MLAGRDTHDPSFFVGYFTEAGPIGLPACPLMHGTGAVNSFGILTSGGSVVCLESRRYDAVELLDTIDRERVSRIAIVGDAFANRSSLRSTRSPIDGRWTRSWRSSRRG